MVDTATVDADGDLSVTFGDLDTGTTYTATVVATNAAGDSAPATASATPFVPADTTRLTIAGRACPDGTSITWTVDNDLAIPVSFDWIAKTADTRGTAVVEANSSTQVTTDFDGPTRNVFRVVVDQILQDRTQSRLPQFCDPVLSDTVVESADEVVAAVAEEASAEASEPDLEVEAAAEVAETQPAVDVDADVAEASAATSAPAKSSSDKLPAEGEGTEWVAGDGADNVPPGFEIKGNASSRIYHPVESSSYSNTIAEIYFATGEAAEKAGYRLPKNLQASGSALSSAAKALAEAASDKVEASSED